MNRNEVNNMNFAVVPSEFLNKVETELLELKLLLREKSEAEISEQYIESVKIPKLLGISRKTWQTYRDRRLIPFSQIGSKIYVKRADIENFMASHRIETDNKY